MNSVEHCYTRNTVMIIMNSVEQRHTLNTVMIMNSVEHCHTLIMCGDYKVCGTSSYSINTLIYYELCGTSPHLITSNFFFKFTNYVEHLLYTKRNKSREQGLNLSGS